ncbi:hypothetical protein N0V90_008964 [Kalmusia sp. IMI 367209]|nr:hypothetical protein N0V90_008964 [Kalmusia sp. IMI 367209]
MTLEFSKGFNEVLKREEERRQVERLEERLSSAMNDLKIALRAMVPHNKMLKQQLKYPEKASGEEASKALTATGELGRGFMSRYGDVLKPNLEDGNSTWNIIYANRFLKIKLQVCKQGIEVYEKEIRMYYRACAEARILNEEQLNTVKLQLVDGGVDMNKQDDGKPFSWRAFGRALF